MQEKTVYTAQEVQKILGVTYKTIQKLAEEGAFETFRFRNRFFIKKDSFDDWLFDTGGKDPIIEEAKTGMWEPEPDTEKETDKEMETEEIHPAAGTETAEGDTKEQTDTKPVVKQEAGSASEETGKIQSWCYSVAEAARVLGVSPTTMYTVIKKNNIHYVSVGTRILLPKRNFHKWLEKALSEPGRDLIR